MAEYKWPEVGKRTHIGKRIKRLDGPDKVSGKAKYTFDINRPGMLFGKMLRSPYAHAKIVSIDLSAAEKMPGVKAVKIVNGPGTEIQYAGFDIVAVAAETEGQAEDAVRPSKSFMRSSRMLFTSRTGMPSRRPVAVTRPKMSLATPTRLLKRPTS
jgi:xanthine dehydrogenase YagR molybdenum-binding subunit